MYMHKSMTLKDADIRCMYMQDWTSRYMKNPSSNQDKHIDLLMLYVLKISSVQMQLCNAILTQLQNEFAKDAHSNYGYVMCAARHETM